MPTTGMFLGVNVKTQKGFTLIELMIVVAVMAVLATIALPSYRAYVRKAHRTDAQALLQAAALKEESFRADNPGYTDEWARVGGAPVAPLTGYFDFAIAKTAVAGEIPGFSLTATAKGDQAKDRASGVACTPLVITVITTGATAGQVAKTPVACWSK